MSFEKTENQDLERASRIGREATDELERRNGGGTDIRDELASMNDRDFTLRKHEVFRAVSRESAQKAYHADLKKRGGDTPSESERG